MPAGRQRDITRTTGPRQSDSLKLSADGIFESQPLSEIAVRVARRTAATEIVGARAALAFGPFLVV